MTNDEPLADLFVLPQAMREFRALFDRAGRLTDADIIEIVQAGCALPTTLRDEPHPDDVTVVRVRELEHKGQRYAFRAIITPPERKHGPNAWPVVVAVLPGGGKGGVREATDATEIVRRLRRMGTQQAQAALSDAGASPGHAVHYILPDGSGINHHPDGSWEALRPDLVAEREAWATRKMA